MHRLWSSVDVVFDANAGSNGCPADLVFDELIGCAKMVEDFLQFLIPLSRGEHVEELCAHGFEGHGFVQFGEVI